MYQNVIQFCYLPINTHRLDTVENITEDVSVLENEDEELPRPETVTVSALPDEFCDDTDSFPCQDSDPLSVDPLAHRGEPVCITIKEEKDDSEVSNKVEPFNFDASSSDASNENVPDDDGYRSASDEGAASRGQPGSSHIKVVACEKEHFSKGQNTAVEVEVQAEVNPGTDVRQRPCDNASKQLPMIQSNTIRSEVATCHERAISDELENPLSGINQRGSNRRSKEWAKIQMCAALSWSKGNLTKKSAPVDNLLPSRGLHESVRVVLTRCMEAEELVASMKTAGQIAGCNEEIQSGAQTGTIKGVDALIIPSVQTANKIPRLKLRKVGETSGWEMAPAADECWDGEIRSGEERWEYRNRSNLENMHISSHTNVPRTGSKRIIQNDLTLGNKSSAKISLCKESASTGKEEQAIGGVRDELVVSSGDGEELNSAEGKLLLKDSNQAGAALQPWKCIGCHRAFKSVPALSGHIAHCRQLRGSKVKILGNSYTCKLCAKTFSSKFRLLSHSAMHKGSRRLRCSICKKDFDSFSGLKAHSRMHKTENSCECEVCGRTFVHRRALNVHKTKAGHTSGALMSALSKPVTLKNLDVTANTFPCEVCNLTFSTSAGLTRHRVTHSEQLCDAKGLSKLSVVPTHQSSHGQQLHEPQLHVFSESSNRDRQCAQTYPNVTETAVVSLSQKERKVFSCEVCGKKFSSSLNLKIHVCLYRKKKKYESSKKGESNPTKNRWSCHVCGKTLSCKSTLQQHLYGHEQFKPYQCHLCPRKFSCRYRFKVHFNVHTGERPYRCDVCGMAYHNADALRLHKNKKRHLKCNHCGKFFSSQKHLETHKCFSSKPNLVSHDVDQNISSTAHPLKKHVLDDSTKQTHKNTQHKTDSTKTNSTKTVQSHEGKFTCKVCRKTTTTSAGMIVHMLTHSGKPPHCDVCDKTFSTRTRLKDHLCSRHTFERPYQCNLCDNTYCGPDALRVHKLKHRKFANLEGKSTLKNNSSGKAYKCNFCGLTFPTYLSLKTHKCFHMVKRNSKLQTRSDLLTNGKTYKCDLCTKSFTTYGYLVRHKNRYHSGKPQFEGKLFDCNECSASYSTHKSLIKHYSSFHQGKEELPKEVYEYKQCNETYNVSSTLLRHNQHLHRGKHGVCNLCGAVFTSYHHSMRHKCQFQEGKNTELSHKLTSGLKPHSSGKIYKCKYCEMTFPASQNLAAHVRIHHNMKKATSTLNSYKCAKCNVTFNQRSSLLKHNRDCHIRQSKSNRIYYKCNLCSAKYLWQSNLVKHKSVCHGEKSSYQCNVCSKAFSSGPELISHCCEHFKKPCYSCSVCGNSYDVLKDLKEHMLMHTTLMSSDNCVENRSHNDTESIVDKHLVQLPIRKCKSRKKKFAVQNFRCDQCKRSFLFMGNLKRHKLIHANQWPYPCKICGHAFRERCKLALHMLKHSTSSLGE